MEEPMASAWMTAFVNWMRSGTPVRSPSSLRASRRDLPRATSRRARLSSWAKGPSTFSATRARAASRPRPASTQGGVRADEVEGHEEADAAHAADDGQRHDRELGAHDDGEQQAEAGRRGAGDDEHGEEALHGHGLASPDELLFDALQQGGRQQAA